MTHPRIHAVFVVILRAFPVLPPFFPFFGFVTNDAAVFGVQVEGWVEKSFFPAFPGLSRGDKFRAYVGVLDEAPRGACRVGPRCSK